MNNIRLGVPQMKEFWDDLCAKVKSGQANKNDEKLYKKVGKAMALLSKDPRYPGLETHEISALSQRYGMKVWESYLENNTPAAGRIFWVYGPNRGDITIIGLEPHPNDKVKAYDKVTLSSVGDIVE
ncbi:MAG: hypothetical protein K5858_09485 [Lachnospiraceae bacterium]|nr:hypothetical protein [Lachnospiraceae bacterium]